jgi:hypothetical protein
MDRAEEVISILEKDYFIEFWKSGTREHFKEAAQDLIDHEYTTERAADFLSNLYSSCGQEYGC